MKRSSILFAAIFAVSMLIGIQAVEVVDANPMIGVKPLYAKVSIETPLNGLEYNSSELSFTIKTNLYRPLILNYSDPHCFINLDSKSYEFKELSLVWQTTITNDTGYDPYIEKTVTGNTLLSNFANLAKGSHIIEVKYGFYYAFPDKNYTIDFIVLSSATSQFTLTQDIALTPTPSPKPTPTPSLSSIIQNMSSNIVLDTPEDTYKSSSLIVNFTAETNWLDYVFYYSLDHSKLILIENLTIISAERIPDAFNPLMNRTVLKGSCLLSDMSNGWHNITVYQIGHFRGNSPYANNLNSASSMFFVDTQSIEQPLSEGNIFAILLPLVGASSILIVVASGLLVYFRRRKGKL
jgi:hypothetical protein